MTTSNADIVLSAIRLGNASVPAIRAATGLSYDEITPLLHRLMVEWRSIRKEETGMGFERWYPVESEKTMNGHEEADKQVKKIVERGKMPPLNYGKPDGGFKEPKQEVAAEQRAEEMCGCGKPIKHHGNCKVRAQRIQAVKKAKKVIMSERMAAVRAEREELATIMEIKPLAIPTGIIALNGRLQFDIHVDLPLSELMAWEPAEFEAFWVAVSSIQRLGKEIGQGVS